MSLRPVALSAFTALSLAAAIAHAGIAAAQPAGREMAGTWDLIWQTRHGPEQKGYLVVRQSGTRLEAEIHGQGSVKAKGTLAGRQFALRGSRLAIPYLIAGTVEGNRLAGSLRILSVERRFTGLRR